VPRRPHAERARYVLRGTEGDGGSARSLQDARRATDLLRRAGTQDERDRAKERDASTRSARTHGQRSVVAPLSPSIPQDERDGALGEGEERGAPTNSG